MESLYRQLKFISNTQLGKRFWKSDALRGEKCTAAVSTLTPDETTGDIDGNTIKDGTLVILMTKKMILTTIKLMVKIFIIEPVTEMAVMFKMLVMREIDDEVSIILVFQGNSENRSSNPPFRMLYLHNTPISILSCKIYSLWHITDIIFCNNDNIIYNTYT